MLGISREDQTFSILLTFKSLILTNKQPYLISGISLLFMNPADIQVFCDGGDVNFQGRQAAKLLLRCRTYHCYVVVVCCPSYDKHRSLACFAAVSNGLF